MRPSADGLTGQSAKVRRVKRMVGALGVAVLAIAGCGSAASYDNTPRPPAPIVVSVSLGSGRVSVSPSHVGAGPVVLLVANESDRSRDVTLSGAQSGAACVPASVSSGPVNPQGTARVQVELVRGACAVGVRGGGLRPARLTVGPERASAQSDVLQP
jgi:hypothetical protein